MEDIKDKILENWDLSKVLSPSYVLNEELLDINMRTIDRVRQAAGVEIIVALKASAMWSIFPILRKHSDGATASSLSEAMLVFEKYGKKCHTYAPVYSDNEFDEIACCSSHITFNTLAQYERYKARAKSFGISCGLRVNPEFSTVETDLYNPASPTSRLGVPSSQLTSLPEGIEGLHFHSLCESRPKDLRGTLNAVEEKFGRFFGEIKWLNMGGGHLMTHKDYDCDELIDILKEFKSKYPWLRIILEPGSAFTWDTGVLLATVEDTVCNGGVNTAILNVSFACHMPDCLEMPYKPVILGGHDPKEGEKVWRIGGNSCLAGDFCGDWAFDREPCVGDRLVFRDMIHYTMVKTTMFNGVTHPSIIRWNKESGFTLVRRFGYEDFKNRMS